MKNIEHKFKRWIQSIVIKSIKSIDYGREKRSAYELDCLKICKKLINRSDSTLLLTPISHKRYIKNDSLQVFVTIDGSIVNVINHKYSYTVPMSDRSLKEVTDFFNNTVEEQRAKMEAEITSNIKHSLKDISISLD
jgi:viroplasmin and RNaseH domain-containing protein